MSSISGTLLNSLHVNVGNVFVCVRSSRSCVTKAVM